MSTLNVGSINSDSNFNSTGAIKIPVGTSAQRPSTPQNGHLRFNSELNQLELYGNGAWSRIGEVPGSGSSSSSAIASPSSLVAARASNGVKFFRQQSLTYEAYALTTTAYDGGGWALAFNINASTANLSPGGIPHWDNTTMWTSSGEQNQSTSTPWLSNVKTRAYDQFNSFTEILILVHTKNDWSSPTNVRGWSVYKNDNYQNQSMLSIISGGNNRIISSGGRKASANYVGYLTHNSRRNQTRGGDPFIDALVNGYDNAADQLVFNATGYWGSSAVNNTRITTTAGNGNTSYGHTTSGIGIRHGHSGWGYYAGWTPIQSYCEPAAMYTTSSTMGNNYTSSPESGNIISSSCDNIAWANGYLDAGIAVFLR